MSLPFHTLTMDVHEKYIDVLIENPFLFVCGVAHVKNIRSRERYRSGAPYFLYVVLRV
jgi:hypothetical protein